MRYDLTKEIKITPEMEEQYDKGKKLVIATSRLYGFFGSCSIFGNYRA